MPPRILRTAVAAAFVVTAFALAPVRASDACPDATFCAGSATGDITPPVSTPMWGYTAREGAMTPESFAGDKLSADTELYGKTFVHSRGIHLRLYANAFVLRGRNGVKTAIVQTDLGGVPGEVHQAVANRVVAGTGIDRDHLLIGATHTHQGPGGIYQYQGYALLGGDELDPRVFEAVVAGITNAVERANDRLAPAKLAWTQAQTSNANRNRRVTKQWCLNPESMCGADFKPTASSPATNDPLYTVMRIDRIDGVPLGVITNFAAHGTIGGDDNPLFSGDNQGWATRLVSREIRERYTRSNGPLPDDAEVVDALINGAQGDQSPIGSTSPVDWMGSRNRQYAEIEDAGRRQAEFVLAAWDALGSQLRDDVDVDARFEFLCFCGQEVDPRFAYDGPAIDKTDPMWNRIAPYADLGMGGIVADDGTESPVATPAQGHKMTLFGGVGLTPSITRLQVLRVGDLVFAGVPGEPTVTAGRRIRSALLAARNGSAAYRDVVIAGLANDYVSYYATPEEYTAAQYEGSFTLFGPQSVPLLTQELVGLMERMLDGSAVPDCAIPAEVGFCATHPVHPDTSGTAFPPIPIVPDLPPSGASGPSCACRRMDVPSFTWLGGSPTAEWRPDADRVRIQRLDGETWQPVAGDATGVATILRYSTAPDDRHRWTAQWDVPLDAPAGTYRFHVEGSVAEIGGARVGYDLASAPFAIAPAILGVTLSADGTAVVRAAYPAVGPDSFRWRPRDAAEAAAALVVIRNGESVTLTRTTDASGTATFALEPGDVVVEASVTDVHGNAGSATP